LAAATHLDNPWGRGNCFHLSAALLLDLPHGDLCIGTLRGATPEEAEHIPNASPVPFIHCWVEQGARLFAPTTIKAAGGVLYAYPRDHYYERNGIAPASVHRLNRAGIKRLARTHGWSKAVPFGNGLMLAEPLGTTLLAAMGVAHEVNDDQGVVPPGFAGAARKQSTG
jgi:hypothetical protein